MRLVVPVVLTAACGGGKPPPPADKPVVISPKQVTRVPIEDKDDEPQDGISFKNSKGHMEQASIEAGLAPHAEELSECYTSRVGRRRWLGGRVLLHWDIQADGTITSVKLAESDLGAWQVEKCLLDVARTATFEKPVGGSADFALPLEFFLTKGGAQIWDEDKALAAVGGQLAGLDECSDPSKKVEPKQHPVNKRHPAPRKKAPEPPKDLDKPEPPPRNVTITMYVGPHGKAQSVGFSSSTSEIGEHWAMCAEQLALAWRLPDPRGQYAKLAVRYKAD